MSSVSFQKVCKRYSGEKRNSVNDFNLEVNDGEFLVLVGPSGCGKSTLLRMLAGLEEISSGEIHIGSRLINYVSPKDRDIAMVFQNYALYPHMSVYENIAFGLRLRKMAKSEIHERVTRAAKILEIEAHLQKKPKAMSGGQRQRVALGRAIVREPDVFLFDEPLSNLDAKLRVQMREEIGKLYRRLKATMIYVTHDQVEAMTMGTRIVVMKDGNILQVATPEELYTKPANLFVAGFIGSPPMNVLRGKFIATGSGGYFETKASRLVVPAEKAKPLIDGKFHDKEVVLGVRAENIVYRSDELAGEAFADTQLQVQVEMKELLGSDVYLYVRNKEHKLVVRVDPRTRFEEGQSIRIGLDMELVHFFDPQTEGRLC
ncbi:ABC transporter ATP-binding protein [Paenibacillus sacheonensis]|uniref:sn-glycerol-3-phosphate ABC transporter ATP-binding protein UgpC n=1 Tax=Paenibacillus sacheonensis TaxID=742054 RepID=A0A7X4YUY5_9BACL|nr:sn-glycerol-3-phosphate ABC transporter ATP-binding protein UgpC [Paenibacillus sacheonensis]MBM7568369.1 multiple sugar transport system ATP-binding protein [Paenibacillus sacheonensis]NBC72069.1 sn-glycerol-3-phosphate ABC transporter ATP-binding protein UgpC [Paenibacillus sacheonensis]